MSFVDVTRGIAADKCDGRSETLELDAVELLCRFLVYVLPRVSLRCPTTFFSSAAGRPSAWRS